jgi:heat shock protein HslJ
MNVKLVSVFVFAATILLMLASCSGIGPGSGDPLDGTSWRLVVLAGSSLIPETEITASFADGQVGGQACNSYGGSYTVSGDKLTVRELYQTEMACLEPEGIMEQESQYMDLLRQADNFSISGQELRITSSGGDTLIFVAD